MRDRVNKTPNRQRNSETVNDRQIEDEKETIGNRQIERQTEKESERELER